MQRYDEIKLSEEQNKIIELVGEGKNIFVDACIGAGKTTLLNAISESFPRKKILYLTYNKLLKEDAKKKIRSRNTEVHNYHGFVFKYLMSYRLRYTHQDGIKNFIRNVHNGTIRVPQYDLILIDEYQDINEDAANLIQVIKESQKEEAQFVFVGDMKQKIYDKTTLDVVDFIFNLKKDFIKIDLTQCFRLNNDHASKLGRIWNKKIIGVNQNQKIKINKFDPIFLLEKLNSYENGDILILTPFRNNIILNQFINFIEKEFPDKYNKRNLYITISDSEDSNKPLNNSMIVTTFDGSKGLERKLAVVFGFETDALEFRSERGNKEITRNLFLVAASRGKDEIIFIEDKTLLNEENFERSLRKRIDKEVYYPSEMFDFAYDEMIDETYSNLEIEEIPQENKQEIETLKNDFNILMSPVIGIYQEAIFFKDWNYEKILKSFREDMPIVKYVKKMKPKTKIQQVLCLTAVDNNLMRYITQATQEFIDIDEEIDLLERLNTHLNKDLPSQIEVNGKLLNKVSISGYIDTIKEETPFELKFVETLQKRHFLQLATYMLLGDYEEGILWNTKKNEMFKVKIKDRKKLEVDIYRTILKR